MSTNAHDFPAQLPIPVDSIPVDSHNRVHIDGPRLKKGLAPAVRPFRGVSPTTPKVALTDICQIGRAHV